MRANEYDRTKNCADDRLQGYGMRRFLGGQRRDGDRQQFRGSANKTGLRLSLCETVKQTQLYKVQPYPTSTVCGANCIVSLSPNTTINARFCAQSPEHTVEQ